MNDQKKYRFSLAGQPLYPYLKLTRERFPRLLATRVLDNDDAEYFGAFLTRSSARMLIDFMNRTFRLRTCEIEIDGSFNVPCTQYYSKRCLAPCVQSLCSEQSYSEMVELSRFFLADERERFAARLNGHITAAAEELDFEKAAIFRDIGLRIEEFWQDKRRSVWLDDAVDTLALETTDDITRVYLITQRNRRMLGMRVFSWPFMLGDESPQAMHDVIEQFYKYHAPREIRVSHNFPGLREMAQTLSERFGRLVRMPVVKVTAQQITTARAMIRTKQEIDLASIKPRKVGFELAQQLQAILGTKYAPDRIEAFDAAHISGSGLVAAMSVWEDGRFRSKKYDFWLSDRSSELDTLQEFVRLRLTAGNDLPQIILMDGGKSHLNAALKAAENFAGERPLIISAVKPPGKHSEISHFLIEDGSRIEFDANIDAMNMLKILRDEAHDLSNSIHRESRDMSYFYELASILPSLEEPERQRLIVKFGSIKKILEAEESEIEKFLGGRTGELAVSDRREYLPDESSAVQPLIVPIRYDDPNGEAGDLRPIHAR